ncbi:ankyrin repeat-containing domain protein [Stachybotrys elegans]|uniref:Ankyrin repeat-containing domain protein n=1 Tax=Stachybotrys elegans TaxID=80388 RepID=A0A8K0SV00_9HYPO|nr:ankyrin repeat-containing domain protein [Stachybotrys elegans]
MAAVKAPRKTQEEWERHKPEIEHLWVQDKVPLKKLRDTMHKEYNFIATTSQYQTQFKRWGGGFYQQRNIKKDSASSEWLRVYRILRKREAEGKKSQVYKFGRPVSDSDVQHEIGRYLCNLQQHHVGPLLEPSSGSILSVATPSPVDSEEGTLALEHGWLSPALRESFWNRYLELEWPTTLPVFAFETNILPKFSMLLKVPDYHRQMLFLSTVGGSEGAPYYPQTAVHTHRRQFDLVDIEHSRTIQLLLTIMPQTSAHVHFQTAELISKGQLGKIWLLRMLMYVIANNLRRHTGGSLCTSDDELLRILEDTQISDTGLKDLRESGDAHALCLLEELFACAVRLGDVHVASRLLRTGADPDQLVNFETLAFYSVTEEILMMWDLKLRMPSYQYLMPALLVAIASGNCAMASCLVQNGAMNCVLLKRCLGLNDSLNVWHVLSPGSRFSSDPERLYEMALESCRPSYENLCIALQTGMMFGIRQLVQRILQTLRTHPRNRTHMLEPDRLLAAILLQDDALVTDLRDKGYILKSNWYRGWSPISLLLRRRFFLARDLQEDAMIWAVIQMLELGADANQESHDCPCPLLSAVQSGSVQAVELLLRYGGNPDSPMELSGHISGMRESTLLSEAIHEKQHEIATLLLDRGVSSRAEDLALAINNEWADLADRLIHHLDDLVGHNCERYCSEIWEHYDVTLFQPTPLSAAIMGKQNWAQTILERCPTLYDPQALWCAIYTGKLQHVEIILQRRPARTHAELECVHEGTALALAVVAGFWEVVQLLNLHGITPSTTSLAYTFRGEEWKPDFFVPNFQGQQPTSHLRTEFTPLHWIIKARSEEGFQYMLQNGANPDLGSLQAAIESGSYNWVDKLLELGADVNNWHGRRSCLGEAIATLDVPMVRRILAAGAKVDESEAIKARRWLHTTAFQMTAMLGNLELFELLVDVGANANEPASANNGSTSLQLASLFGHLGIVKRLLDLGADYNAPAARRYGSTALEAAAQHGRLEIVKLLLDFGVRTDGPYQRQYIRAVKFAKVEGHTAIVKILRNHRQWTNMDHELYEMEELEMEPSDKTEEESLGDEDEEGPSEDQDEEELSIDRLLHY